MYLEKKVNVIHMITTKNIYNIIKKKKQEKSVGGGDESEKKKRYTTDLGRPPPSVTWLFHETPIPKVFRRLKKVLESVEISQQS